MAHFLGTDPNRRGGPFSRPTEHIPYVNTLADPWGGAGQRKSAVPHFLARAVPRPNNITRSNAQLDTNSSQVQYSRGGASPTAPAPGLSGLNEPQFAAYEHQDSTLPTHNDTRSLLPSGIAHNHSARSSVSYIGQSDEIAHTAVPVRVPPYADRQPIAVNRELEHYNSANLYLPGDWANSPLDNVQHAPFNDPGTAYDSPSSINIDELSRQPQQIDVGCDVGPGDFAMAFSMGPSAERMDYNMGNPSYNEISPTGQYEQAFWQEPHQSMGNFPMCMDVQEATEQSIGSGHSKAHGFSNSSRATSRTRSKRQRSDSPSAGSSSAQSSSPSGPSTGTRHSQRRQVVGSDATRRAGEKRRRAPATFVCDICGSVFTRNHNRQNHIRTHNGEAGAQCTICNKFLAKTSLSRHMKKCRGTS